MRIYKVHTEHTKWGRNFNSYRVSAKSCEQAIRKVKKHFVYRERVESVELLAAED